jgi:hypothetical protein
MRRGNLDSFGRPLAGGRLPRRCAARNDSVKCDKCSRTRPGLATRRPADFGANAPTAVTPGYPGSSRIALEAPGARWEDGLPGSRPIGQRLMCRPVCVGTRTPNGPRRQRQLAPRRFDPWSWRRDRPIEPKLRWASPRLGRLHPLGLTATPAASPRRRSPRQQPSPGVDRSRYEMPRASHVALVTPSGSATDGTKASACTASLIAWCLAARCRIRGS